MKPLKSIVIVLSLIALASCHTSVGYYDRAPYNPPSTWKTLQGDNYNVKYPPTWKAEDTAIANSSSVWIFPVLNDTSKKSVGITISISKTSAPPDIEAYGKAEAVGLQNMPGGCNVIYSGPMKIGSKNYYKLKYTYNFGLGNSVSMETEQWLYSAGGKICIMTVVGEHAGFDLYQDTCQNIMSTFSIKD